MKDFYDLYYFYNYEWKNINASDLKDAINATFGSRGLEEYLKTYKNQIEQIKKSEITHERWKAYKHDNYYADGIDFNDLIEPIDVISKTALDE